MWEWLGDVGKESRCLTEAARGTGPALTGNAGRQPKDTFSFTWYAVLWHAIKLLRQLFIQSTQHLQSHWWYLKRTSKAKSLLARGGRVCVCVCVRREGRREGPGGETSWFAETKLFGKPPSFYRWPASRIRQATAVMSAAPLPLPSSDWRKVTSHFGDNCFTVSCMTVEKL